MVPDKRIEVAFFRSSSGAEPVKAWIKSLNETDRKIIGKDLLKIELGFPIGMPVCRSLGNGLWECRSSLTEGKIARVIFCVSEGKLIALHGFIKKTQKTPKQEIDLALRRKKEMLL
jgi:phage-related protein